MPNLNYPDYNLEKFWKKIDDNILIDNGFFVREEKNVKIPDMENEENIKTIPTATEKTNITVDKNKIAELFIRKNNSSKLTITVKLYFDVDFLKDKNSGLMNFGGAKVYYPKKQTLEPVPGYFAINKNNSIEMEGYPTLLFLLGKEPETTFKFEIPTSEDFLKSFATKFKEQIKILYLSYCKPFELSMIITGETVEKEFHL